MKDGKAMEEDGEREGRAESQYDAVGTWEGIRFTPRFLDDSLMAAVKMQGTGRGGEEG